MSATIYRVLVLLPGAMLVAMGDKYEKYCIWGRYSFEPDPQSCFFHTFDKFELWWRYGQVNRLLQLQHKMINAMIGVCTEGI